MLTQQDCIDIFEGFYLPSIKAEYEQDGVPDIPARREGFNNLIDALCKDGMISSEMYHEMDNPY